MYTNKVIEAFNAGILELNENERGVTLRSYLSKKLGCDPMRITKKYTGASCLGKKVYHSDNYKYLNRTEVESATSELKILEQRFRSKLEEMNKKKIPAACLSISTPAIDALVRSDSLTPNSGDKRKIDCLLSSSDEDVSKYLLQLDSNQSQQGYNYNSLQHQKSDDSHGLESILNAYNQSSSSNKLRKTPLSHRDGYKLDDYPPILPMLNNAKPIFLNSPSSSSSQGPSKSIDMTCFQGQRYHPSQSDQQSSSYTSSDSVKTTCKDTNSAKSSSSYSEMFGEASRKGIDSKSFVYSSEKSIPATTTTTNNNYNADSNDLRDDKKTDGNNQQRSRSNSGNEKSTSKASSKSSSSNSMSDQWTALESDQNAAVDSLIGFFNHIRREQGRSHDDLVDYVTSVQLTVDRRAALNGTAKEEDGEGDGEGADYHADETEGSLGLGLHRSASNVSALETDLNEYDLITD